MMVELVTVTPEPGLAEGAGRAAAALVRLFERHGFPLRGSRVVSLQDGDAERALREAIDAGGLVVCLGEGEGAAAARAALARILGVRLVLSDSALEALAAGYARHGRAMPRRAEALALVPQGASVLLPPGGGEPGLLVEAAGALVALLPAEAAPAVSLAEARVLTRVVTDAREIALARTLRLVGLDPEEAAARVTAALADGPGRAWPPVEVDGELRVRLTISAPTLAAAERRFAELEPALRRELGVAWYGVDEERLEAVVGRLLTERGLTVGLAESCTGGLIASRLTDVPGSSRYFERGMIVYSNAAKQALLGIPESLLVRHGAVSAECAEAMARGVRTHAGTDLGLSVTGIAGPDGGTPAKPVGTVFVGLADARGAAVRRFWFDRDREGNKRLSAVAALDLLRRHCLGLR